MLFHKLDYLVFLALAVTAAWLLRPLPRTRIAFLLFASLAFYGAWSLGYLWLIGLSILVDYSVGRALDAVRKRALRRLLLGLSLCANLGLLFAFKYLDFLFQVVEDVAVVSGLTPPALPRMGWLLPVGISFYTFQTLAYSIDVYRGRLPAERNLLRFALFVTFFPQLVAGPIVRAQSFLPQLQQAPQLSRAEVGEGLSRIATGLTKKLVFADYLSLNLVDRVFDNPSAYTATEVLLALYGFTVQIYCDFSGYTDVARGSAQLLGLSLPQNFDRPYLATNPADFWRRWHMTLSTWLRDYLYFPLGGSRCAPPRAYFNLALTLFLIGLWHGAAWTFVVYGALQALAMVAHRFVRRRFGPPGDGRVSWVLRLGLCFHFVVLSRILFRASSWDNAVELSARLLSPTRSVAQISPTVALALAAGLLLHLTPRHWYAWLKSRFVAAPAWTQGLVLALLAAALMRVSTSQVVPYIYFQF